MKHLLTVALLAPLPLLFSACCSDSHPRFWEVRDITGGGKAYAVDTVAVPLSSFKPGAVRYVSGGGKVGLHRQLQGGARAVGAGVASRHVRRPFLAAVLREMQGMLGQGQGPLADAWLGDADGGPVSDGVR